MAKANKKVYGTAFITFLWREKILNIWYIREALRVSLLTGFTRLVYIKQVLCELAVFPGPSWGFPFNSPGSGSGHQNKLHVYTAQAGYCRYVWNSVIFLSDSGNLLQLVLVCRCASCVNDWTFLTSSWKLCGQFFSRGVRER